MGRFNGFGGGGGMGNMQSLMKQAQKMQADMQKAQEELEEAEIKGESGSGLVVVTMNGKKTISAIKIEKNAVDVDDLELLEDLIVAAINDGYSKADELADEKMGGFPQGAGGMF